MLLISFPLIQLSDILKKSINEYHNHNSTYTGRYHCFAINYCAFMKKEHYVKREIIINAPSPKVFDYLKLLKNQDKFNKHAQQGPDRKKEFKGTDGTVGYIYAWSGNKDAGEGEKEIKNIIEGKRIEMEIRFVKPMKTNATIIMEMESLSGIKLKYPGAMPVY
jgi:hypothetical protein